MRDQPHQPVIELDKNKMTDEEKFILKPILPYAIWLAKEIQNERPVDDDEFQNILELSIKRIGYSNITEYKILMSRQFQLTQVSKVMAHAESLKRDKSAGQIGLFQ